MLHLTDKDAVSKHQQRCITFKVLVIVSIPLLALIALVGWHTVHAARKVVAGQQVNRSMKLGNDIEEAHMRNRQLVAAWAMEKGASENVIEKVSKDGKTYFKINDYDRLRALFGDLLKEIQRIKSEGDYEAGKALVENYGVKVDQALHKEVLERNSQFTAAPYGGFINPDLVPEMDEQGNITDVKVVQPESFAAQMLRYAKDYTTLPDQN